jgi:hypothetical protein
LQIGDNKTKLHMKLFLFVIILWHIVLLYADIYTAHDGKWNLKFKVETRWKILKFTIPNNINIFAVRAFERRLSKISLKTNLKVETLSYWIINLFLPYVWQNEGNIYFEIKFIANKGEKVFKKKSHSNAFWMKTFHNIWAKRNEKQKSIILFLFFSRIFSQWQIFYEQQKKFFWSLSLRKVREKRVIQIKYLYLCKGARDEIYSQNIINCTLAHLMVEIN